MTFISLSAIGGIIMYNQIKTIYNKIMTMAREQNAVILYIYMNMNYETGNFAATTMIGGDCYKLGYDINNEFYVKREETNKHDRNNNKKGQ